MARPLPPAALCICGATNISGKSHTSPKRTRGFLTARAITMATEIQLKLLKEHGRKEIFLSLARVPGSSRVLCGASDGNVYDLDPLAEKPEFKALGGHASFVTGVAIAGDFAVSGGYDGKLLWRKLESGEIVHTVENAHSKWIRKVANSPDGKLVASVADAMVCRVWEADSAKKLHELRGHDEVTPNHFPSMLY